MMIIKKPRLGRLKELTVSWVEKKLVKRIKIQEDPIQVHSTENMGREYKEYIEYQANKSIDLSYSKNPLKWAKGNRRGLLNDLKKIVSELNKAQQEILSVGCRDILEIGAIKKRFKSAKVTGIDLFSSSKEIVVGDMHNLPFSDSRFDSIVMVHSLEHSINPEKALLEAMRCLKIEGLLAIEIPVRYEISKSDIVDFKDIAVFIDKFPNNKQIRVIYSKEIDRSAANKPNNLRIILKKLY